jgi:hypothetical protein
VPGLFGGDGDCSARVGASPDFGRASATWHPPRTRNLFDSR